MCQYLFAAMSLKHSTAEGLTPGQLVRVEHWEKLILAVARQEMEHLGLVANLLTSIGASPVLSHPDFPYPTTLYGHDMELTAFSEDTVTRFACYEKPPNLTVPDLSCTVSDPGAPWPDSVAALWATIQAGFQALGSDPSLFVVGPDRQLGGAALSLDFPRLGRLGGVYDLTLMTISDLASAEGVITLIIDQGEAAKTDGTEGHFRIFKDILDELRAERKADPSFQPARAVVANPSTSGAPGTTTITDPLAVAVLELFDNAYQTMLVFLMRLLTNTDEEADQTAALETVAFFPLMTMAIRPLAEVLTGLPTTKPDDGTRAGPSFATGSGAVFLPHRAAAWTVLTQQLQELTDQAHTVAAMPGAPVRLAYIAETLSLVTARFAVEIAGGTP